MLRARGSAIFAMEGSAGYESGEGRAHAPKTPPEDLHSGVLENIYHEGLRDVGVNADELVYFVYLILVVRACHRLSDVRLV